MASTDPTASSSSSGSNPNDSGASAWETDFRWLVAWLVLLLVLWAINRTAVGRVVTYYALALMLLFLLVTQFKFIAGALAPFASPGIGPGLSSNSDTPDTGQQGGS